MSTSHRERLATQLLAIACVIQIATAVAWAPAARGQATNTIDIVTEGGVAPGSYHLVTDSPCAHGYDGWSLTVGDSGNDPTYVYLVFNPDAPENNRLELEFDPGSEPFTHYYSWGGGDPGTATVDDRGDSATLTMTMGDLGAPTWDGVDYSGGSATVTVTCDLIDRLVPLPTVAPSPTPQASPPRPADLADGKVGWWRVPFGPARGAPVRDATTLYLGEADALTAVEASSGATRWRLATGEPIVGTAAADDLVVGAGSDGLLVAAMTDGTELWRRSLDLPLAVAPLVAGDTLFTPGGTTLVALDAASGEEQWRVDEGGSILATPILASGLVVASGATLRSYDQSSGAEQWSVDLGSAISTAPTMVGQTLVAGNWDGEIVGVDAGSGTVLWRSSGHAPFVLSSPASTDAVAVFTDDAGDVTAVDVADGRVRWSHTADSGWAADGSPVIEDGTLYLVDVGGVLHVGDPDTGEELWSYLVGPTAVPPLVSGGMIHVRTDDAILALGPFDDPSRPDPLAADLASGGPEDMTMAGPGPANTGRHPGPDLVGEPVTAWRNESMFDVREPIVASAGRVIAVGGDGVLYALESATGDQLWRFTSGNRAFAPAITDDVVLVGDQLGFAGSNLYAVDIEDGRARWHAALPGVLAAPIVTDGDRAYASMYPNGGLLVFDVATGTELWHYDGAGPPSVSAGVAYVLTRDSLVALEAASGEVRWRTPLDFSPSLDRRVSVGGGAVYVPYGPETLIFDASTGEERGPSQIEGGESSLVIGDGVGISYLDGRLIGSDLVTGAFRWFSGPVADLSMLDVGADLPVQAVATAGFVYAGTTDGSGDVIALDPSTGEERWRFATGATGLPLSTPAVLEGMVFVGTGAGVVAITGSDQPIATPTPAPSGGVAPTATPAAPAGDVAMSGGDQGRSGSQPGPAPQGNVTEVWRFELTGEPAGAPVVADGLLAVIDTSDQLLGLDPATGSQRWSVPMLPEPGVRLSPVIHDGAVYAPEGTILHAVDAPSGTELWTHYASFAGEMLIDDGVLIANTFESIAAVDVGVGEPIDLWVLPPDYELMAAGAGLRLSPAVAGGRVFSVSPINLDIDYAIGVIQAFDEATGEQRWRRDDLAPLTAPASAGGIIIVGTADGQVVALAPDSGATLWSADVGSRPTSRAAIGTELVIVGTEDGSLVAVTAQGTETWRFAADAAINVSPVIAGDTVIAVSPAGVVYALDAATGEERWRFDTGGEIRDTPSIVGGLVYVSSGRHVVALGGDG